MGTTIATARATGTARDAARSLTRDVQAQLAGAHPALVMAFASTKQPLGELLPELRQAFDGAVVLGSSTAGEFTETGDAKGSVALVAIAGELRVFAGLGTGLRATVETAVEHAVRDLPSEVPDFPHRTVLVLLDPLAGNGEEAVLITSARLGGEVRLAGGAAGDDLEMKATYVGCGAKTATDAIVVATIFTKQALGVGVCHGHEPLSQPLKVTKAAGNVVYEIEGIPAWTVWERETRASAAKRGVDPSTLAPSDVGAYLLRYEAGLASGIEYKIRAPLSRNPDGSIAFACGIPQGAVIRITESEPSRQIESARIAARRAKQQVAAGRVAGAVVFDCICRNLILADDFARAVKAISDELGQVRLAGFETYGEIALDAGDMSGFHNTTTVVLAFPV